MVRFRTLVAYVTLAVLVAACASGNTQEGTGLTTTAPESETTDAGDTTSSSVSVTTTQPTTSPSSTTSPAIDLEQGLVAYYPLDGDAVDIGPDAREGEVHGAVPAIDRAGSANAALEFNGVDDIVALDAEGFALGRTFSVAMMIKGDRDPEHQWVILSDHMAGECHPPTPSWILRHSPEFGVGITIYDSTAECGTDFGYGSAIVLDDGEWHHLAVVASDGVATLYLDCVAIITDPKPLDLPDGPYPLLAGNQGGSPASTAFAGVLDELRFYDRTLTQAEIDALCATP